MTATQEKTLDRYFGQWVYGSDYFGEDFSEYWVIYTKTSESYSIDNSNYECIKKYLDDHGIEYIEPSFNHWAVSWVQQIMVHDDIAKNHIEAIWQIGRDLDVYPIFNEDHYSETEYEAIQFYWECLSVRARARLILEFRDRYGDDLDLNIFQARHDYCYGDVFDCLREWGGNW